MSNNITTNRRKLKREKKKKKLQLSFARASTSTTTKLKTKENNTRYSYLRSSLSLWENLRPITKRRTTPLSSSFFKASPAKFQMNAQIPVIIAYTPDESSLTIFKINQAGSQIKYQKHYKLLSVYFINFF